ncbi:MAG: hypothetical protein GX438_06080 [Treponema sp.]|nr:hypothetical protein [Treponema sp.]
MKIKLDRKMNIKRYRVLAKIEKAEKRPEIHSLLLLAQEKGTITPSDISENLLAGKPESVCRRLLQLCESYGLVQEEISSEEIIFSIQPIWLINNLVNEDSDSEGQKCNSHTYVLTKKGIEALKQEQVFVPEKGLWEIEVTDDLLWPQGLIKIQEYNDSNARKETKNDDESKKKLDNRMKSLKSLEKWVVERLVNNSNPVTPLLDKQNVYRFVKIEDNAEETGTVDFEVLVMLTISENDKPILTFKIEKEEYTHDAPEIQFMDVWWQLLEQNEMLDKWDDKRHVLRVKYSEVLANDIKTMTTFKQSKEFEHPEIADLGKFNTAIVTDIPIVPATQDDADAWAKWLLERSINCFAVKGKFEEWQDKVQQMFPYFNINFPEQDDFANMLMKNNRQAFWYLQAPLDWNI